MRASRLLSLLLLLQSRGRMSAPELARELEVSVRTVHRDVDALSAAGIPVVAERGPAGGFLLLDGYRTRLTGFTGDEAGSLALTGVPGVAAELGLGSVLAAAELKLLAALPPQNASRAGLIRERFHLDAPGWFHQAESAPFLAAVADAVWTATPLRLRYRRWRGEVTRDLAPLGLVLKSGSWYLVASGTTGAASGEEAGQREGERTAANADRNGSVRTYRVSRILDLETLSGRGARPPGFDLAVYWDGWLEEFERRIYRLDVVVRVAPRLLKVLPRLLQSATLARSGVPPCPTDPDGRTTFTLAFESADHAVPDLLRCGPDLEVLAPPEIRARLAATAAAVVAVYGGIADRES